MDKLARRSFEGLGQFMIALGVFLFLPAWTLMWWQAWLFLFVFGASVAAITFYFLRHDPGLIERRLAVGATAEKQRSQKIIQAVAGVIFILVFVTAALDFRLGGARIGTFWVICGDVLTAAGLGIVFLVFKENSYTSAIVEVGVEQKLVSTGPYALVRHPMYSGTGVLLVGVALALGSLSALLPAALLMVAIVMRLQDEERFLVAHLDGYADYRQKVRFRLVPYIW